MTNIKLSQINHHIILYSYSRFLDAKQQVWSSTKINIIIK